MNRVRVNLNKGFVDVYDFGNIKLHCYQTNDAMNDESYILENDKNVLLLEFPAFYDNLEEFEKYVKGINKNAKNDYRTNYRHIRNKYEEYDKIAKEEKEKLYDN